MGLPGRTVRSLHFRAGLGGGPYCSILPRRRLEALADVPVLALTEGVLELAQSLVSESPIPSKSAVDAIHIAVATVYACEYLLTWNCRHIANAEIQRTARHVVRRRGFELPVICTPEELMGGRLMNRKDEIIEEIRAAREAYAARFNYDLEEKFKDLKAKEHAHRRNMASQQPAPPHLDLPPAN